MANRFCITQWNARGVKRKREELRAFLQEKNALIAAINETHLQPDDEWRLPGWTVYRTDRELAPGSRAAGSAALLVHNTIRHRAAPVDRHPHIEAVTVDILAKPLGWIRVSSVYYRPAKPWDPDFILKVLGEGEGPSILLGDLNAAHKSWNSRSPNQRGSQLKDLADEEGLTVLGPITPTHESGNVLDIAIVRNIPTSLNIHSCVDLTSDHNPVVLYVGTRISHVPPTSRLDLGRADWESFRRQITRALPKNPTPPKTPEEADGMAEHLAETISASMAENIPMKTVRKGQRRIPLPHPVRSLIRCRNNVRRRWQRYRTMDYWEHLRVLNERVKNALLEVRRDSWEAHLNAELFGEDERQDNAAVWKMCRMLKSTARRDPVIRNGREMAITPEAKAELLADHLEAAFTPNPETAESREEEEEIAAVLAEISMTEGEPPPSHKRQDVGAILSRLPSRKAPGPDNIPNVVIRELPQTAVSYLASIFTGCTRIGHFPAKWKLARIICLPKMSRTEMAPGDFRPISLLDGFDKAYEKILLHHILDHVRSKDVYPTAQYGFREGHSTVHQLTRTTDFITDTFNRKGSVAALFLDISKAFDRVWHGALLMKMHRLRFPAWLIKIVASYLDGRRFSVRWFGRDSSTRRILAGVPQGSLLGPSLFNIFTHDIPSPGRDALLSLYADDAAILCRSRRSGTAAKRLQFIIDEILSWYRRWRIAVNAGKTKAIVFQKNRQPLPQEMTVGEAVIQWETSVIYLGVILDRGLLWKQQVERARGRGFSALYRLRAILKPPVLSLETKLRLYRTCVLPVMTYASPVWSSTAPTHLKRLQVVQNACLRCILNATRYESVASLHEATKIKTLKELLPDWAKSFFDKAKESPFVEIQRLAHITVGPRYKYKRPIASRGEDDFPPAKPRAIARP